MNPPRPSLPSPLRPRGSALITVLLFTFIISLLVGSILTWSITERRLNTRTVHWIESRNAAESLCEYGAAQVSYAISNLTLPDPIEIPFFDPLQAVGPNYNPPQLPVIPGSATSPFNPNSANGITTESHATPVAWLVSRSDGYTGWLVLAWTLVLTLLLVAFRGRFRASRRTD